MKQGLLSLILALPMTVAAAAPPMRIVTLTPHTTELVAALAPERLVAVDRASNYPPQIKKLPHFQTYPTPSVETILAFQPDLVLTWENLAESRLAASLLQRGIAVLSMQPQSIQDVANELRRLGKLLQLVDKAEVLAREQERRYADLRRRYANLQSVRAFLQISETPLLTVSGKSFLGRALHDCSGSNAFETQLAAAPQVSREAVLTYQPEVIIALQSANALGHWHRYVQLSAVRNKHLYAIEDDSLQRPGPRLIDGLEALCALIDRARAAKMP